MSKFRELFPIKQDLFDKLDVYDLYNKDNNEFNTLISILQTRKNIEFKVIKLFREIDTIGLVRSNWLEKEFLCEGPFWSRNYRFFRNRKPLTIIREVFNPYIEKWIGDSDIKKFKNLYSSSS